MTDELPFEPPPLSKRARLWLVAIPVVLSEAQMLLTLSDIRLPGSPEVILIVENLLLGALALTLAVWVLKADRRAIGLTLANRRTTLRRTAVQLLILAGLTVLYSAAIITLARTGRVKIPIESSSLTEFQGVWIFIVMAVFIGPLYEELLWRGMLTSALKGSGRDWATVLGSAALFALPHWAPGMMLARLIGPFVVGLLLAWSFLRTRSILTSFAVHAAFNAGVVVKDLLMHYQPELVSRILGYK